MEYKQLTSEQQAQLREEQILDIEAAHYRNLLARERAIAMNDEAQANAFLEVIEGLEQQHAALTT